MSYFTSAGHLGTSIHLLQYSCLGGFFEERGDEVFLSVWTNIQVCSNSDVISQRRRD